MPDMSRIDPELLPYLESLPPINLNPVNLPILRETMAERLALMPVNETISVQVENFTVPGLDGAPPVRILGYFPTHFPGPFPAILHIHGGGYVFGTPEDADDNNRYLANELGCAIFSVDYRLAPETPHPGALEDCYAALAWLSANATRLQVNPDLIGVKGESAGGGLAAALALLARDQDEFPIAFQHLAYPMLDDRTCTRPDPHPYTGQFVWTCESNHFSWSALLGGIPGGPDVSPYAAPARAENLAGLPPTYIFVGELDLFLDEDLEYAIRLTRAGVLVELHVYPGAYHCFDLAPDTNLAAQAKRDSIEALRKSFGL